jgi:sporulation protein YlmC with PRC-barrel domain
MKPDGPLKLVSQLLDLPLIDKDGRWCGVVDDVEFDGAHGKPAKMVALLVGPGAYQRRLPGWAFWLVRKTVGDRITRVPVDAIESITAAVHLKRAAEDLQLHRGEDRARRWIPRKWAL